MNISESLPGHLLTRNGTKYLIVKAHDSTVVAAYRDKTGTLQTRADSARRSAAVHRRLNEVYVSDAAEPAKPQFTLVD